MENTGSLKKTSITGIIHSIYTESLTGALLIKESKQIEIYFYKGNIAQVKIINEKKNSFLDTLFKSQNINQEQLSIINSIREIDQKHIIDILVEDIGLKKEMIDMFYQLYIKNIIFPLFLLNKGSYLFSPKKQPMSYHTNVLYSENILREGFEYKKEWPILKRKYSNSHKIPYLSNKSKNTLEYLKQFKIYEKNVYNLINSNNTIKDIIDLSGLGIFYTYRILYKLESKKIMKLDDSQFNIQKNFFIHEQLPILGIVLMITILFLGRIFLSYNSYFKNHTKIKMLLTQNQIQKLHYSIHLYHVENGTYPKKLFNLVERDWNTKDDLKFPWKKEYIYHLTEEGYEILPPK